MRIALAQINYHIGNFEENLTSIAFAIKKAQQVNADLVVFSELAVCGYPPLDLLESKEFIDKCQWAVEKIASICTDIAAIVGAPSINLQTNEKNLFNSAFFLYEGKIKQVIHKTLLPTYDIFDEDRYFESNTVFNLIEFKGKKIALTVCEDLWYEQPFNNSFGKNKIYRVSPMEKLSSLEPDFIINISASPFAHNKTDIKKEIFKKNARKYCMPVFMVNQVGANTDLIFEGGSLVVNPSGEIYYALDYFTEDFQVFDLQEVITQKPVKQEVFSDSAELIHNALVLGIHDYFQKTGFKKGILGLSGGIDSAVTLVLAEKALGSENLHVLILPSRFSTRHSLDDALSLAKKLDISYDIIDIQPIFDLYEKELNPYFKGLPVDITEENLQSRIRGNLLMAYANKFGLILLNTSNKSESSVGYGTLYGDMCGGIAVLGDVYKTEVYQLAAFINKYEEIIPLNTINKPPSAELRPNQKDSDSLPAYDQLDPLLFQYIEYSKSAKELIEDGFAEDLVERVLKLVKGSEYKRYQSPPVLRVSSKSFGRGRRMPLVGKY
jgi:NAD+ synthase (glutamine-hydrolysing)